MKTIKKIVALATGATMLGATIMGAMAADLSDYPAPFVEGCAFSGAIVVGANAAAEDVVGGMDIIAALAQSGTTTATSGTSSSVTVSGEAAKIETSTKKLTLGSSYDGLGGEVRTVDLNDGDLPVVLADGTFVNKEGSEFNYEQTIGIQDDVNLTHFADSSYNDKEPNIMVYVNKNLLFLTYTLDFTKDAVSDNASGTLEDFEDKSITMLGNSYDITTATASGTALKLVLMGGAVKDVMEQGEVKTFSLNDKDYEVEVTYIGGTTSKVKFKVNGEVTDSMLEDGTFKLADGTTIGVREILEEEAGEVTADQVEFYIGAEKIELNDANFGATTSGTSSGTNVKIDEEDVEGLYFDIVASHDVSNDELDVDKIILTWIPDDELFVTEEQSVLMPGLESIKVSYEGFTTPAEEVIEIQNNGDDELELVVPIKSGKATFSILHMNKSNIIDIGGADDDERLLTAAAAAQTIMYDSDIHEYFVASDSGAEESYLLEITDIDDTNGVDFKDVVTGTKYEDKKNGSSFSIGGVTLTVSNVTEHVGGDGDNTVNITASATGYFDRVYSAEGLTIYLPVNYTADGAIVTAVNGLVYGLNLSDAVAFPTSYNVVMVEEDRNEGVSNGYGGGVNFNVTVGTGSNGATVSSVAKAPLSKLNYYEIGDTDEFVGYVASDLGTKILYDTSPDQDTVKIVYHGGESFGNVFISEAEAGFGKSEGVSGTAVCKVAVPPAKLDSELSSVSAQNLILLGGPCANTAAAEVMGVASTVPECLAGFEEGKAMIKLYDTGAGKVAMLVAGFSAMDTRRASRVVAQTPEKLVGDEVVVSGTSLTDISVSAVTE